LSGPRNSCSRSATCQSESPVEAAKLAGYPQGSQFAASARKRARRKDVKATVAELQKPAKEKLAKTIEAYENLRANIRIISPSTIQIGRVRMKNE
jgi:hypothetical protein